MSQTDFLRKLPDAESEKPTNTFWQFIHIDPILLLLVLITLTFGLVVLYSASDGQIFYLKRQILMAGAGLVAMIVIAQIPPPVMQRWVWLPYTGGLVLLVLVIFHGLEVNGAQRWLDLGPIAFQPSEILKLALPLLIAAYLSKRHMPTKFKHVFMSVVMIALPAGFIVVQPDLGTSLLVAGSGLAVLFTAGLQWRYMLAALVLLIISAPLIWKFGLHDYQQDRIITMFNPEADRLGAGWNIIQSVTAIGSGGWSGKGWLLGTQSHLDFLPESHTDFIIAVLAEEFGFRGVCILLGLYLLIIGRGFWISYTAKSPFSRLASAALVVTFFVYVSVNMAMVSGLLPVVGVPLPLVSYGGTSLVSLFMMFGILMAVSTEPGTLKS
jgi:rod shape determining protein RodA